MSNHDERCWFDVRKRPVRVEAAGPFVDLTAVETLEGDFEIDEAYIAEHGGYYLVRGVEGEVYPCAVDVFEQTYTVGAGAVQEFTRQDLHEALHEYTRDPIGVTRRLDGISLKCYTNTDMSIGARALVKLLEQEYADNKANDD